MYEEDSLIFYKDNKNLPPIQTGIQFVIPTSDQFYLQHKRSCIAHSFASIKIIKRTTI